MAMVSSIRVSEGRIDLAGYPPGSRLHGWSGPGGKELGRLASFMGELELAQRWLNEIPPEIDPNSEALVSRALADAALLAFCRCFDFEHPLKPLKPKKVFSPEQRPKLERLRRVRNRSVAHDDQLSTGTFSLVANGPDYNAIEAVSLKLSAPFLSHGVELPALRELNAAALAWVRKEHWRVASEIVSAFNALPLSERMSAPDFTLNIEPKDHYGQ